MNDCTDEALRMSSGRLFQNLRCRVSKSSCANLGNWWNHKVSECRPMSEALDERRRCRFSSTSNLVHQTRGRWMLMSPLWSQPETSSAASGDRSVSSRCWFVLVALLRRERVLTEYDEDELSYSPRCRREPSWSSQGDYRQGSRRPFWRHRLWVLVVCGGACGRNMIKHDLETWESKVRFLSSTTPRTLTLSDSATGVPATLMVLRVEIISERMGVPISIGSVLSGLSERPLQQNQVCNSSSHLSSWARAVSRLRSEMATWSCVSSAFCCCMRLWAAAMWAMGDV